MWSARYLSLLLVVLCACLAACSSPGRSYTDSKLQETLEIEILPNTSKMFVYRLRTPENRINNEVHIEQGSGPERNYERGGISVSQSTPKHLHENAAFVVKHMGYCREGFLEIDYSLSRFNLWMKGECKEGATDDDIKKFGTKQILPVKIV